MENYQRFLIDLLPEKCERRKIAELIPGPTEVGLAALTAERCLNETLKKKGIPKRSFGEIMFCASVWNDKIPIEDQIHDEICGCQDMWTVRGVLDTRQEFTLNSIEKHHLPTKAHPWTNGEFTAWTVASGSHKAPAVEVKFYRGEDYVGSVSLSANRGWSLYCIQQGKGQVVKSLKPIKSYESARQAFLEEFE